MALPMTRPTKHPKTGIFMLRKRVPDDLRSVIGKREEKVSLGTRDPDEAKRLHARALAELENRWATLRSPEKALSPREIRDTVAAFANEYLAAFVGVPAGVSLGRRWPIEGSGVEPDHWLALTDSIRADEGRRRVSALLEGYLANAGLRISQDTTERLIDGLASALDELAPSVRFRDSDGNFPGLGLGKPASSLIPMGWRQFAVARNPVLAVGEPPKAKVPSSSPVALSQLVRGWSAERSPRDKTLYSWERVTKELEAFLGHDDASRISADDLIRWKAALIEKDRKPKTIRDGKLAPIRAILQWGVDNRRLDRNVAERVTIDLRKKLAAQKRQYSEEEARTVLKASVRETDPVCKWVPLICAYTGARVSEVCQLRTQDVVQDEGVWCVKFVPEAGALKNPRSERSVPLHPRLIEYGLLTFVKDLKPGPLFPALTPDRFGSRGGNGTKIIGRWVRELGIIDPRVSPSHSWRRRFRTLGRRYGLAVDILDAIMGHRRASVADTYGTFPIAGLDREIRKIPPIS